MALNDARRLCVVSLSLTPGHVRHDTYRRWTCIYLLNRDRRGKNFESKKRCTHAKSQVPLKHKDTARHVA